MPSSRYSPPGVRRVLVLVLAVFCGTNTNGAEVDVKNDSLIDGNSGTPCACFVSGESTAAWLTSPCNGDIVAVQVFWRSQFGGGPSSAETAISIFGDGAFPTPGAVLVNQDNSPAVITAPTLSDGALNEFRHLDVAQNIPLSVPISSGETFVVSLEVFNQSSGDIFAPTFVYDLDGCQANRNAVDVMPGGWFDACLVGVTGDWMIRAVVDCAEETPPEPPTQAPFPHDIAKNRYISIDRGNPGLDFFDIKLTLAGTQVNSVPGSMIDSIWWAGCPDEDCISLVGRARSATPPDWSRCRTVHLTGCPIIPTSTYEIVVVDGANESAPVYEGLTQLRPGVKWHGDCVGFFTGTEWTPPNGQTSIDDAVAAIKTFQNPSATPGCGAPPCNATHTSVTDVVPNLTPGPQINKIVNIADVFSIIQGFQGNEYSGGDIGLCPNADEPCPGPCAEAEDDTPCEDGDVCTIGDTCQAGECVSGADDCQDKEPGTKSNEFAVPFSFQKQAPTGTTGMLDPVYLFSGEFYESVVDLRIAGRGFDFVWGRKYRSKIGPNTAMGNGWDFSYNIFLEQSGSNLIVHNGDTRQDTYVLQGDGTWARAEFFRVIEANFNPGSDPFTMTFPDTGTWNFHAFDGSPAEGKLATIVDRNGNTMRFDYDALGRLTTVHDTLDTATHNRDITIAYDASGFIESVTDFAGRSVTYAHYDGIVVDGSPGDLESVTTPPVMNTPNFPIPAGHDYLAGKKTTYTYSTGFADDRLNHNLLTTTDPKGQTYLINEYDPTTDDTSLNFDRIVRQTWGNTGDLIDLVYLPQVPEASNNFATIKTIVNDRVGNVKELSFDARNRGVIEREYTGRANPDMPTTETTNRPTGQLRPSDPPFFEARYEYNSDALLTRRVAPNGNELVSTYDETNPARRSQGNLLEACRLPGALGGDQPRICASFEYDDGFGGCCGTNFLTRHVDGRAEETLHSYDSRGNRERTQHRIPAIVEDWEYNPFGQVTAHTLPDNGAAGGIRRRDEYTYYDSGPQLGYLKDAIIDSPNFALTTTREYNLVGQTTRVVDSRGKDTQYIVNQLDQTVRRISREVSTGGVRYERDTFYDPNDNVARVDTQNVDDQDVLQANTHFATVIEYGILDHPTRVCTEVGDFTGSIPGTPQVPVCSGLPDSEFITVEYEYDANRNQTLSRSGEAVERRQPNNVLQTEYDERDLVFRLILAPGDADQSTSRVDYDGNRNVVTTLQGLENAPRTTQSGYDGYDRLVSAVDPMGNEATYHYDANDNLTDRRVEGELLDLPGDAGNIRLAEVQNIYDEVDRLTRESWEFFDRQTQSPVGDGQSTTNYFYTHAFTMYLMVDDNNHDATISLDTANRVSAATDAKGNTLTYVYDANSNVVELIELHKSDLGNPDETYTTNYTYDALDRLTSIIDPIGNTTTVGYDSRNNLTVETDALSHETRYRYDGINRLTQTVHDMNGTGADPADVTDIVLGREWDDASRLVAQTDDNGNVTQYAYDALDRLIRTTHADTTTADTTYDVHNNRVLHIDANGSAVAGTYDLLDRLTGNVISPGPGIGGTTFENFSYDGVSNSVLAEDDDSLATFEYDSLGRATREILTVGPLGNQTTGVVDRSYDGVGNRLTLGYPGGRMLATTYDELDRISAITELGFGLIANYDFIGPQRMERMQYGNNTQSSYTYDGIAPNPSGDFGVQQMIGTTHMQIGGAVFDQREYSWDRRQNKVRREDVRIGGAQTRHDYEYDDMYRLTRTQVTDPLGGLLRDTSYLLDGVGNRERVLGGDCPPGAYSCDPTVMEPADCQMNQYTSTECDTRQYDRDGNMTGIPGARIIIYNYADRMIEHQDAAAGVTTTYSYDALGRRVVKVVSDVTGPTETRYFYDGWQVIEEQHSAGATQATYVYGGHIDDPLQMRRAGDFYYHADDLGNVMAMSDATGTAVERYEYADYGAPQFFEGSGVPLFGSLIGNPYLFSGRRYDPESGLYYFRTRYLDPLAGRFLSRDSIGIWGDCENLGNAYTYVGGNPWTHDDPFGLARSSKPKEIVVVGSKVKEVIKEAGLRSDGDLVQGVSDKVHEILKAASYRESDFDFVSRLMEGGAGVVSDPGFGIIKPGFHSGGGDPQASKPPRPHFKLATTAEPFAGKKAREIVVVGSKVKDVVRSAGFGCQWPMCGGWLSNASTGADEESKTAGGIFIPDTAKERGHLDDLKAPVDPSADYIKNMVTGAAGMKLVEAIIKPSKSPMPQTREHILLGRQPAVSRMKIRPLQDRILIKR